MTVRHALALLALAALAVETSAADPKPFPGTPTKWQGFARHDIEGVMREWIRGGVFIVA